MGKCSQSCRSGFQPLARGRDAASTFASLCLAVILLACPAGAAEWERVPGDLLSGFYNMYQPCVVEIPDGEYRYGMWFFGWATTHANTGVPGCDAIFHARSKDLAHWEVYAGDHGWAKPDDPTHWAPVVSAGEAYHDCWHNGDPSVAYKDGRYYLAYSATSKPGHRPPEAGESSMLCSIMGATSPDGIHWKKTAQPLLIETEAAQKAQDVKTHFLSFLRPSLHWDQGRWRMWFDYWHPRKNTVCMGYAENTGEFDAPGGFVPVQPLETPLLEGWPNPEVVRAGDTYHAFGDPPGYPVPEDTDPRIRGWRTREIREAVSKDNKTFEVKDYIHPDEDAAACHVPQALVTKIDGATWIYLFYATQRGGWIESGGKDYYDYRYNRIRAVRRRVEE